MSIAVFDASATVKLFIPEVHHVWAREQAARFTDRMAPDIALVEVASAVLKKVRRGELLAALGLEVVHALTDQPPFRPVHTARLVPAAYAAALETPCSFYDALYVVLALEYTCPLVTADPAAFASYL